ncbi:hypothetical protein C5C95_15030 [Rathayibacter sp. AY1B7]|nr:hypothetical protein C5C64_15235 [Rathayibacter sp. AY1D3]PPH96006.1 hypothetical protein C5C95_15030 [Rathayibacter sp. AY1B7]
MPSRPEDKQLHSTLGTCGLVMQPRTATMAEFDAVIEQIRTIPVVRDTRMSRLWHSLAGQPEEPAKPALVPSG